MFLKPINKLTHPDFFTGVLIMNNLLSYSHNFLEHMPLCDIIEPDSLLALSSLNPPMWRVSFVDNVNDITIIILHQ
jgi:hypothetical protein